MKFSKKELNRIWFMAGFCILLTITLSIYFSIVQNVSFFFFFLIFFVISAGVIFLIEINKRYNKFPVFDIGFVYILVIILYFLFPVSKYIASDYKWGLLSDVRLYSRAPEPSDLLHLFSYFLVYLLSFGFFYLWFLSKTPSFDGRNIRKINFKTKNVFLLMLSFQMLQYFFTIFVGASNEYASAINSVEAQSLLIKQLYFFLLSATYGVGIVTLVAAGLRYQKDYFFFWGTLGTFIIPTVLAMGSRHTAVSFAFLGIVVYHIFVKKIPTFRILGIISFLLLSMLVWGAVRSYQTSDFSFLTSSEFEACFATFYEVLADPVGNVPLPVYFSDIIALLPQQILPFTKMDGTTWYMTQYFPEVFKENPQVGYGFGVFSEAAIGFGILELAFIGFLHGVLFANLMNHLKKKNISIFFVCIYLFCLITVFRTFRSSSFELLRSILFGLGPAFVILYIFRQVAAPFSMVRK